MLSAPGLVLMFFTMTFAFRGLLMTLEPHWYLDGLRLYDR